LSWARAIALAGLTVLVTACSEQRSRDIEWLHIPGGEYLLGSREQGAAHPPTETVLAHFDISATEIGTWIYCDFLNDNPNAALAGHPQFRRAGDVFRPAGGAIGQAVAHISYDEARQFCHWLSARSGATVRLPTPAEWEAAARGGLRGARYPWGWGSPPGHAAFAAARAPDSSSYPPNGYGIYDMAGGLFEWCRGTEPGRAPIRGGSWAEKDPRVLRVFHEVLIDCDYRGADVGFRVVREIAKEDDKA
jgi:formylglycine-generating enzyme required for sulfatase activity